MGFETTTSLAARHKCCALFYSGSNNVKKRSIVDISTPLLLVASSIAMMSRKILREMDKRENCR
jgi:hypothetical protein